MGATTHTQYNPSDHHLKIDTSIPSLYPRDKGMGKKRPVNKMWLLWKYILLESQKGLQRKIQTHGGANQFGRANAASLAANPSRSPTRVTPDILDKMDDYMDNMAYTVPNRKAVIEQLVATNAKQSSTITT